MKFSKKILKNGLRVLTVPMKGSPTVTVLILVETGSKYESEKLSGISHFLEHMCFKGTAKRPRPIDIAMELDAIGSQNNAFTSQEYTGYYAKADARHFDKIFDVVSDIYLNSTLPAPEIEKEKGVIIEEINLYEDQPHRHVQDLIMQLLYGAQPAGRNIAGNKRSVLALRREDFLRYKKEHYLPNATLLVVAGDVAEKRVLASAQRVFGPVARAKKTAKPRVKEVQARPEVLVKWKKTDQTHFVLAFRSFDIFSKKNPALEVLAGILGGGMSSRLFQKLREEMGVGYYVRSYDDSYTDHGFLQISAGVDNRRIEEVIRAVLGECRRLREEIVGAEELEKVKEYLIGNMKLSLEGSDDVAHFFGTEEILRREVKTPEEKAREIRKVTANDIQKLAREIFREQGMNLALIGPFKNKAQFQKLLRF